MLDARKNWIRPKNGIVKDKPMRMLFRRTFYFDEIPETAQLMVSADFRYKLYVNGQLVEAGPCNYHGGKQYNFKAKLHNVKIKAFGILRVTESLYYFCALQLFECLTI